jgi:protein TonB
MVEILVAETGDVSVLSVVRGHPLLDELAKNAVSQWKYRPVVLNGRVVPVILIVAVPFVASEGRRLP